MVFDQKGVTQEPLLNSGMCIMRVQESRSRCESVGQPNRQTPLWELSRVARQKQTPRVLVAIVRAGCTQRLSRAKGSEADIK